MAARWNFVPRILEIRVLNVNVLPSGFGILPFEVLDSAFFPNPGFVEALIDVG